MSDVDYHGPISIDQQALNASGHAWVTMARSKYDGKIIDIYWRPVLNPAKSREAGMPIEEKQMFIKIFTPGETSQEIDRPLTENDKIEFPRQWAAFQQNKMYIPEGTAIEILFPADPHVPRMLRQHGFHTVQMLAKATPHAMDTVGMGMQDWVNRAHRFLTDAKEHRDEHRFEQMKEKYEHEIGALKIQIAELVQRLGQVQTSVAQHMPVFAASQLAHQQAVDHINSPRPDVPPAEAKQWAEPKPGMIEEELPKLDMRTKEGRALKAASKVAFTEE